MHEIEKLEKKWLKYKFNQFFKKITLLALFFILSYFGISFFTKKQNIDYISTNKTKTLSTNTTISKKEKKEDINITRPPKKMKIVKNEVVLAPKMEFLENIEILPEEKNIPKKVEKKKVTKKRVEKNITKKPKIVIETKKDENFLDSLIKKFENNPDPKLAIFLSKTYYKEKNYKKSLYWAIKANELDSSNSESWILFAKTSVKLGKKKDAINALKVYLNNYNSYEVEKLLLKIINGEFK